MQLTRSWKPMITLFCFLSGTLFNFKLCLAANENAPEFFSSENHALEMTIPPGWITLGKGKLEDWYNTTLKGVPGLLYMAVETLNEDSPYVMLKFDINPSETSEEYFRAIKNQHNQTLQANPNFKYLEPPTEIEIDGVTFKDPVSLSTGGVPGLRISLLRGERSVVYYHFLRGTLAYTFIGIGPKEKVDTYRRLFEQSASSIVFYPHRIMTEKDLTADELTRYSAVYYELGKFGEAIQLNELALGKNPIADVKAEILYHLSANYYELGLQSPKPASGTVEAFQKALDYGKQCLEIKPDHWKAMVTLARVYIVLDQLEEADHYFTEAEKYNPKLKTFSQPGFISEHGAVQAALNIQKEPAEEKPIQKK